MSISKFSAVLALGATIFAGPTIAKDSFSPAQKKEIEQLVKDYLLANPKILEEMAQKLEEDNRKAEELARTEGVKANAKMIFKFAGDAVVGNPKGDVTVVEFMDYNCSWCKKSVAEMSALVQQDPNVRVVMKEFPIFGVGSEMAARAALAANKQGKYWELHQAMFAHEGQVTAEVVDQIAAKLGLDMTKLKKDMTDPTVLETITANQDLGKALAINGTPGFVIDGEVVPGYIPLSLIAEKVNGVRANGGCKFC